jgi:hypothetical protein
VSVAGTIKIPGGAARAHRLRSVTRTVGADRAVRMLLKLSRKSLREVRRALRLGKAVKAQITLTATDRSGNVTVRKRTIRLRA